MRGRLVAALVLCLLATACARNAGQPLETPVAEVTPSPSASPSPTAPPVPVTLPGVLNNKSTVDLTSSGQAVSLDMRLADLAFDPTFVKVAPGANITLSLKNDGDLADHTFTIDALAVDQRLAPGEDAQIVVQLPTEGAFRFYCKLHVDRGMQGAFYFNEGEQPSETTISSPPGRTSTSSSSSASGTRRSSSGSGGTGTRSAGAAGTDSAGSEDGEFDLFIPDLMVNVPDAGGNVGSGQRSSGSSTNLAPRAEQAQQPVNTPPRVEGPSEGSQGSSGQDSEPGEQGEPGTQGTATE